MDEAAAREGDQVSLLLDPPSQLERPFARPSDLEPRLAGEDDAAVDEADDERRELGRRHGHHRLVEEREALGDATRQDEHVALRVNRERHQLGVAVALADLALPRRPPRPQPRSRPRPRGGTWPAARRSRARPFPPARPRAAGGRVPAIRPRARPPRCRRASCRSSPRSTRREASPPARGRRDAPARGSRPPRRRGRACARSSRAARDPRARATRPRPRGRTPRTPRARSARRTQRGRARGRA